MLKKIPVGWRKFILKDLFEVREERHPNNGKFPLCSLTIENGLVYKPERYIREFLVKSKDKAYKMIYKGDLVFNPMNLRWGAIAFSKLSETVIASPVYEVLYLKDSKVVDPYFLECMFETPSFMNLVKTFAEGTLIERMGVNINNFLKFPIVLAPINEQHKISGTLSTIDLVVNGTQAVIDQTQTLKKGLMQELFTRGIPGRHNKFRPSSMGSIPSDWKVVRISDIALVDYGISESVSSNINPDIGWPILTGANIDIDGYISLHKIVYIKPPSQERFLLKKGDVLLNWRSGSASHVGKSAIFDLEGNYTYASFILRVRPFAANSRFLHLLFSFMRERSMFTSDVSQQVNFKMNATVFRDLEIPLPSAEEQKQIVKLCEAIDEELVKERDFQRIAILTKSALMQVLLTGEVRVKT